jgi:hypothetical protein
VAEVVHDVIARCTLHCSKRRYPPHFRRFNAARRLAGKLAGKLTCHRCGAKDLKTQDTADTAPAANDQDEEVKAGAETIAEASSIVPHFGQVREWTDLAAGQIILSSKRAGICSIFTFRWNGLQSSILALAVRAAAHDVHLGNA